MPLRHPPPLPSLLTEIRDEDAARKLVSLILDHTRTRPIVCLTSRAREREPALDPHEVLAVTGEEADVYFVETGELTRLIGDGLPKRFDVFNGAARIWWPGVKPESDPYAHPLIHEPQGVYGTKAMRVFADRYRQGPSTDDAPVDGETKLLRVERDRARAQLEQARRDRHEFEQRATSAEDRARDAELKLRDERRASVRSEADGGRDTLDAEARFQVAIVEAWGAALPPDDRRRHPLVTHVLGAEFVNSVRRLEGVDEQRIAWICAMVACGRAEEMDGLDLHALRDGIGGAPQKTRDADGALAWRCAIKRNSPGAPRLHFWRLSGGGIEFANVGHHDDMAIFE